LQRILQARGHRRATVTIDRRYFLRIRVFFGL